MELLLVQLVIMKDVYAHLDIECLCAISLLSRPLFSVLYMLTSGLLNKELF